MVTTNVNSKDVHKLKMLSTNAAGLRNGKVKSLKQEILHANANIVTIQETHYPKKGRFQMNNMVVFEAIRKKKGGGTLIAINKDLKPKLVEEYEDEFELLVVEIEAEDSEIRIISGHGPQENWAEEKRMPFFVALETEIEKAELAGKSVVIEMDANSKLGKKYIPNDPHNISTNGITLATIVERHNLIVANGSDKCIGTITRKRVTKYRTEQSAIDIVMISNEMEKHMDKVHIDEDRKHVVKSIRKTKKGIKVKESDHNTIITEFNIKMKEPDEKETNEIYNLKNKDCQRKFKEYTTHTKMLSSVFNKDDDVEYLTNRLLKKIDGCIAINFNKIRVTNKTKEKTDILYDKMRELKGKNDEKSKQELNEVIESIAEKEDANFRKIVAEVDDVKPVYY